MQVQHHGAHARSAVVALLAAALMVLATSAAQAATYNVTTQTDENPAASTDCVDGQAAPGCSLREAVLAANLNPANDQINLPAGEYVLTNDDNDPDANADLDVEGRVGSGVATAGALTIAGASARTTTVRSAGFDASGSAINSRIFEIEGGQLFDPGSGCQNFSGASLELRNVRVSQGSVNDDGGAIEVNDGGTNCAGDETNDFDGKLTLRTVALTNNVARGDGGAILNNGETAIFDSLIAGNTARGDAGGGIRSDDSLTLVNTTISGNQAGAEEPGGGLSLGSDDIEEDDGELFGRTDSTNVTIAFNKASTNGGGIHADSFSQNDNIPQFFARNTIIAENEATEVGDNCFSAVSIISRGNNLDDDDSCGFGGSGDLGGTDAGLLSRRDNGGETDTFALSAGSAAVDAGTNDECPATDARGVTRPQGARCDIGAFELVPAAVAAPAPAPAPAAAGTNTTTTTPVFVAFPRLLPLRVTARVTKTRTGEGLRLRTTGRVAPPAGLSARDACSFGIVSVSVKSGTRTVSTRLSELRPDCTYISTVTFRVRSRLGRRILSVGARFAGNDRLLRRSAPRVSAGRP